MGLRRVFGLLVLLTVSLAARAQTHTAQDKTSLGALAASHANDSNASSRTKETTAPSGLVPWIDLRKYGARPLNGSNNPKTTGSTQRTSVVVTSNSGWQVPDGLVISKAGNPTRQITPAAPTVATVGVSGSSAVSYECVGADFYEGLTAASPAGTVMTSPVFGQVPNPITTIARASNVVSVTVSGTLPYSSGNYHMDMMNVTWPSGLHDGIEYVTITSGTTFTYSQTGPDETGTITSGKTEARLFNGFVITSAVRNAGSSNIVFTTDVNHNVVVGTTNYPTVIDVSGITPIDMDGEFTVSAVTSNTITVHTGQTYAATETGAVNVGSTGAGGFAWNQMGLYTWPSNIVTCPALAGTTTHYYIYADYASSGTFSLIGSTAPGSTVFQDWGPFLNASGSYGVTAYAPPTAAAVPSTAPSSPQNQEYVGTITSISGTTFTVTPTIPTAVSGAAVLHDQSLAIQAADNVACTSMGGIVYFSGPNSTTAGQGYVVNAPFTLTSNGCGTVGAEGLQWYGGTQLTLNDTLTDNVFGPFTIQNFSSGGVYPTAEQDNYWQISGHGNPLINARWNNGFLNDDQIISDHVFYSTAGSGQVGVMAGGQYSHFDHTYTASNGTSIGIKFYGGFANYMSNSNIGGYLPYAGLTISSGQVPDGLPILGPLIPNIWANNGAFYFTGQNAGYGKGIEFQGPLANGQTIARVTVSNFSTLQNPYTPTLWLYGPTPVRSADLHNIVNDSVSMPCFAEFGASTPSLTLDDCHNGGVTGDPITSIVVQGESTPGEVIGQNTNVVRLNPQGTLHAGPHGGSALSAETQQRKPLAFPFNTNVPLFWEQQTSGVTAVLSGVGTISAGSHTFCVFPVGWNGGDGGPGLTSCASVTTGGSDGVLVSWTATPGAQGYDVYMDWARINGPMLTGTSYTVTGPHNYGPAPNYAGSGLPLIDQNQLATPLLRLTNGNHKLDITAGTLGGNGSLQANTIPVGYSRSGSVLARFHIVEDTGTLSEGTLTVTLTGSAVYSIATSYNCSAQDTTTPANRITSTYSSGSRIVFTGTGTDAFNYTCWGN
jgi:hypothetical protein